MIGHTTPYGLRITVPLPYASVVPRVREALASEGFGILAEMDIAATLEKKLGVDSRPVAVEVEALLRRVLDAVERTTAH